MSGVLRNCHTCARNWQGPASGHNYCLVRTEDDVYQGTMEWIEDNVVGLGSDMPLPSADGCPGWAPGAENTDRAQVAALGDGIDGTSWDVPAMWRPRPWDVASIQSEIDRIEAEIIEKAARELLATANVGWRGHLPLCRGPGGIQAKRLRALVRGVR